MIKGSYRRVVKSEAMFTLDIAKYLDDMGIIYELEKSWSLPCKVRIRPDISILNEDGKLIGIIEVKGYRLKMQDELYRKNKWLRTRQCRRYHIPKVPVHFICGPYTFELFQNHAKAIY